MKSIARLLDRDCVNRKVLDLSKEVLWVSEGQRAVELPAKVGNQKKFCRSAQFEPALPTPGRSVEFFFKLPTLMAVSFASL